MIKLDLTPHVEESSDRAYVTRIIIPANQITNGISNIDFYRSNIAGQNISYNKLIDLLETNGIEYMEDIYEVKLLLTYERFDGKVTRLNHWLLFDE